MSNLPKPGDTGIIGIVTEVTGDGKALTVCAWVLANGYETPDANIYFDYNPLAFEVPTGGPSCSVGAGCRFDVLQGAHAPFASNVVLL
jgi:hypothetical protein